MEGLRETSREGRVEEAGERRGGSRGEAIVDMFRGLKVNG